MADSSTAGTVSRVMIERRGFTAHAIHAERNGDGSWQLQMLVDGQRPGHTLALQLGKVYDCLAVAVTAQAEVAGAPVA